VDPRFSRVILAARIFRGEFTGWLGHQCTCQPKESYYEFEKCKMQKTNFIAGPFLTSLLQLFVYVL